MARIDVLPSIDIIMGLKGVLDFYIWRGLPCVRAWPRYRPARQTDASKAAALLFGAIIKAYSLTHGTVLDQLELEATGIPRTTRDVYVSGVYGNLHEASMSDFLDLLTECRDFLSALTAILNALDSIDTDELVVNVDQSVLPPLAATTTSQATMITALQKIDDLQDALESVALDRLLVRGMDQLFSFKGVLASSRQAVISAPSGWVASHACPAGTVWCITNIAVRDTSNPTTAHFYNLIHDEVGFHIGDNVRAIATAEWTMWDGFKWLDPSDYLSVEFIGGLAGDVCIVVLTGYAMTLET